MTFTNWKVCPKAIGFISTETSGKCYTWKGEIKYVNTKYQDVAASTTVQKNAITTTKYKLTVNQQCWHKNEVILKCVNRNVAYIAWGKDTN